jgi:type VI secretion system secreted protein VgrG
VRELLAEEMRLVAGGLKPLPPITLRGFTVRPPRPTNQTLAYHPPSTGGEQHHGGGGGGGRVHVGAAGGGLSPQAIAGISRIKDQLGVDLTTYAQMSPTLAWEIASATATWNFNFAYDARGSRLEWDDQVKGTIYINSAYQNDIDALIRGMSHELGHVDHKVSDDPLKVTPQQYVNNNLVSEGFATLSNERVQREILAAGGRNIGISGNEANHAFYDAEYERFANRQISMQQAAITIGAHYGQHELAKAAGGENVSYNEYYLRQYHDKGGRR